MEKHRNPDGTFNGVGVLSEVSGLPRDEVQRIWEDVKANHARLDGCPWHDFEPIPGGHALRQKYRCRHCAGVVDKGAYHWHEQGRRPRPAS